jgi:hypothetical protein
MPLNESFAVRAALCRRAALHPDTTKFPGSKKGTRTQIMGIQTLVVFVGIAIALALPIITVAWSASMRTVSWIVIGMVPLMWTLLRLVEWLFGREIWQYSAPYPYRRMNRAPVDEPPSVSTMHGRDVPGEEWEFVAAA